MKNQNAKNSIQFRSQGFTLIETLVAISIFSLALVGMIVVTAGGVSNTTYVKNKLIATYLAQEALEIVHNDRDSSIVTGDESWDQFAGDINKECGSFSGPGCTVEFHKGNDSPGGGVLVHGDGKFVYDKCTTCGVLHLSSTGFYGYQTSDPSSIFTRTLHTQVFQIPNSSDTELIVTVNVRWMQGTSQKSTSLMEVLTGWVPGITAPAGGGGAAPAAIIPLGNNIIPGGSRGSL